MISDVCALNLRLLCIHNKLPWDAHQLNLSSYRCSEVRSGNMWYQYPRLFYLHSLVPSPPPQLITYLVIWRVWTPDSSSQHKKEGSGIQNRYGGLGMYLPTFIPRPSSPNKRRKESEISTFPPWRRVWIGAICGWVGLIPDLEHAVSLPSSV